MSRVNRMYEVWDGTGEMRLATVDSTQAYDKVRELRKEGTWAKVHSTSTWACQECGETVFNHGGRDAECDCGAQYNAFGQRLRDDWRDNQSNWDDEIGDMEGYEIEMAGKGNN